MHDTLKQPYVILGIGSETYASKVQGTMVSEGASPNDPVFFNHHTMVDCLLDKYLKNTTEGYATLDLLEIDCLLDMVQMTVWYLFSLCILMLICIRLDQNLAFNVIFVSSHHPIMVIAQYNVLLAALIVFAFAYI